MASPDKGKHDLHYSTAVFSSQGEHRLPSKCAETGIALPLVSREGGMGGWDQHLVALPATITAFNKQCLEASGEIRVWVGGMDAAIAGPAPQSQDLSSLRYIGGSL